MSERIEVLRLIYGTATGTTVRGIGVIATNEPALPVDVVNQVIASTHVGGLSEHDFPGAIGAFPRLGKWAVLARYYRSPKPERTGQYFVQRDVFLVPWTPYASEADAAALLAKLPQGEAIETDGTQLPQCVLEIPEADLSRLAAIRDFDDRFIADMLSAALTESVALYSKTPQKDVIPALLLLLPPSIRRHLTFCTLVGDPAVPLSLKGITAFPKSLSGSLADLAGGRLAAPIARLALTDALVQSWREGGDALEKHHNWLDHHLKDRAPTIPDLERAHEVWTSHGQFHADLNGEKRWSSATEYVRMAADSEADRVDTATSLIHAMRLPEDSGQYATFLRKLRPKYGTELKTIVDTMAAKVVTSPETSEAALKIFQSYGEGAEEFVSALFVKLPEKSRNIELLLRLRGAAPNAVSAGDRQKAIANWAFAHDPEEKQLQALFEGLRSHAEVVSLRANVPLVKQVAKTKTGSMALRLTELSLEKKAGEALRSEGKTLAGEAAAAPADAVRAIAIARREWMDHPELALPLTAEILSRVQASRELQDVLILFGAAYTKAGDALLEAVGPALKDAKQSASKNAETLRVLRLADARREVAHATATLRSAMSKVVSSWKDGGRVTAADLISVIAAENEPLEVAPAAWALLSMIADDDRGAELLGTLAEHSQARMFLAFLALAAISESNWPPARDVLPPAVGAVAAMRQNARPLPVPRTYTASEGEELAALVGLAEAIAGTAQAATVRHELAPKLPLPERAKFNVTRLRELDDLLKYLDGERGGLAQLKAAVDSGDIDPGPVRDLADSILERISADLLTRSVVVTRLKDLLKAASKLK